MLLAYDAVGFIDIGYEERDRPGPDSFDALVEEDASDVCLGIVNE